MRQQSPGSASTHLCDLARSSIAVIVPVNASNLALAVHIAGNTLQAPDPWSGLGRCMCTLKRQVTGAMFGVMSPSLTCSGVQLRASVVLAP